MGYNPVSFTLNQPLTAEDLDKMSGNDASFVDGTGIADDALGASTIDFTTTGASGGIWWEEIGRTTLGVAGDTISVTGLPARTHLMVLMSGSATGGTIDAYVRFNNDSGANYSTRYMTTTATSAVSQVSFPFESGSIVSGGSFFSTLEIINFQSYPKLTNMTTTGVSSIGAGFAPSQIILQCAWANTSAQIDRIDLLNLLGTGDFAIGSEVIVLGHN